MRRMLLAFLLLTLVAAPAAGAWSWPVGGAVLRPFVLGDDPYAGGQHRGIDVAAAPGESVSCSDCGDRSRSPERCRPAAARSRSGRPTATR